jgi:hypothetical protein
VIFISYSWRDREAATRAADRFRQINCEYWLDEERLDLNQDLAGQIVSALRSASSMLLLVSIASRQSRWVSFEFATAMMLGRPVQLLSIAP